MLDDVNGQPSAFQSVDFRSYLQARSGDEAQSMATMKTHVEAASTMAVIASSTEPLLYLDAELTIIAASLSFSQTFQTVPEALTGQKLGQIAGGTWNVPQLTSLLKATAAGYAAVEAYEMNLGGVGEKVRRLVVNAHKLDLGDDTPVRLLLAITDVTDARATEQAKDDLLREKAVLLLEVQHRVANILQIIASILMQSARRMQSDEARGQLKSAHSRVMSIVALQRHLAASQIEDVEVRRYLTQLCESLGASMIADPALVALVVNVDDSVTAPNISVSLGLIVTELVINALKHAFPEQRAGQIVVDYRSSGPDWTLTVSDDGVGMPANLHDAKPGLGTSIIEAIARQLDATVTATDAAPGTRIVIAHASQSASLRPHTAV